MADLRGLVQRGEPSCCLPDGTALTLQWRPVRGCYGGSGQAALIACPASCGRWVRVLWRPPGLGWGCWSCRPVSHRSHRRPGSHRRHRRPGINSRKPRNWHRQQASDEQDRIALLLFGPIGTGLRRGWRDRLPLVWGLRDLRALQRHPNAPRISRRRFDALVERLDALEGLRILEVLAACPFRDRLSPPNDDQPRLWAAYCRATLCLTEWAMRRPARDPRSRVKPG